MSTAMSLLAGLASDLAAIVLLAYAVYFRRYHRRDLLLAYVALNVGVLAVTVLLAGAQAGIGLGLGLFGILSIIRRGAPCGRPRGRHGAGCHRGRRPLPNSSPAPRAADGFGQPARAGVVTARSRAAAVVAGSVAGLPAATLAEVIERSALQARVDHKYLVPLERFAELAARLPDGTATRCGPAPASPMTSTSPAPAPGRSPSACPGTCWWRPNATGRTATWTARSAALGYARSR
jgi:hypothetical protein